MNTKQLKKLAATLAVGVSALGATAAIAGDVNGPGCVNEQVLANRTDVYRITFRAGQPAFVSIAGDRDTDLDLEVRDDRGNLVCAANGPTDRETCQWTPRWTGEHQIRVSNLGGVYNNYQFCTN